MFPSMWIRACAIARVPPCPHATHPHLVNTVEAAQVRAISIVQIKNLRQKSTMLGLQYIIREYHPQ